MQIDHFNAVQYVKEHFASHDYGFAAVVTGVSHGEEPNTMDVDFRFAVPREAGGGVERFVFTVWVEDVGNGAFLYGEW